MYTYNTELSGVECIHTIQNYRELNVYACTGFELNIYGTHRGTQTNTHSVILYALCYRMDISTHSTKENIRIMASIHRSVYSVTMLIHGKTMQ